MTDTCIQVDDYQSYTLKQVI